MTKTFQIMALGLTLAVASACGEADPAKTAEAKPAGPIELTPGRTVTVAGGVYDIKPSIVSQGSAGLNPAPNPKTPQDTTERWDQIRARPARAPRNTMVFSLWADARYGTLIRVDNGYDRPVMYMIYLGKKQGGEMLTAQTGTCAVPAGSSAFESRPSAVDAIYVVDMGVVEDASLCLDDQTGKLYRPADKPSNQRQRDIKH